MVNRKKQGFTLAETLITLSILGLIAGVAIPGIISHYRKVYVETRLKQAYSILDNTIDIAKAEKGSIKEIIAAYSSSGYTSIQDYIGETCFKPYLKITSSCKANSSCWSIFSTKSSKNYSSSNNMDNVALLALNNSRPNAACCVPSDFYKMKLANGISIGLFGSKGTTVVVDINGPKSPNIIGYDIFYFYISANTIMPMVDPNGACNTSQYGFNCAKLIKDNGWKIPKDYPVKF